MQIVAQDHQHRASAAFRRAEPMRQPWIAEFAEVANHVESEHLVEFQRALEIRDVDVDVKDRPYVGHLRIPFKCARALIERATESRGERAAAGRRESLGTGAGSRSFSGGPVRKVTAERSYTPLFRSSTVLPSGSSTQI